MCIYHPLNRNYERVAAELLLPIDSLKTKKRGQCPGKTIGNQEGCQNRLC